MPLLRDRAFDIDGETPLGHRERDLGKLSRSKVVLSFPGGFLHLFDAAFPVWDRVFTDGDRLQISRHI